MKKNETPEEKHRLGTILELMALWENDREKNSTRGTFKRIVVCPPFQSTDDF